VPVVPAVPAAAASRPSGGIAIDVRDLRVTYHRRGRRPVEAVRGVSFQVREGEVLALLGPNGAGKTSTVEVLEGYRPATGGSVRVLGLDPQDRGTARTLREQIGIVLQQNEGEGYLTVAETVDRNAGYYPWPYDPDEVIELVGLADKADAQIRTLSGGQRRRLDLALGIIGGPRLLFLDEPTTGFDPGARRSSWELVRSLRQLGTTIVLTTHYMDEAQALADRIIVVAKGEVVAEGTPESLGGRATADARIRFVVPPALDGTRVPVSPGDHAALDGFVLTVTTADPTRALHNLTGWALQRGARLESLTVERPTLEDVYLQLVGKEDENA
jgi:ABC-2 type transport system ATP-binding protein